VPEIHSLAETIETWQTPMIFAITTGLSNARSEGYNRIVKHVGHRVRIKVSLHPAD
jgi:transposase